MLPENVASIATKTTRMIKIMMTMKIIITITTITIFS